jgi:hypothetical protein
VGPYHHDMARPRVVDGGGGVQMWRIAANILKNNLRSADKAWSSRLGVGRRANKSSP